MLYSTKKELNIIFYSISPYSNTNPIRYRAWWLALLATTRRLPKSRIILSGWNENNPQNIAQLRAAVQLTEAKAKVKIGNANLIIHPKVMCFDDNLLLVGSHNATQAGFTRTKNISITTTDELEIARFMAYFNSLWDSIA